MSEPVLTAACDLKPGDAVDLEDDVYANKDNNESWRCYYQDQLAVVDEVIRETPECVLVHFQVSPSIGFPANHPLRVVGQDENESLDD